MGAMVLFHYRQSFSYAQFTAVVISHNSNIDYINHCISEEEATGPNH